MAKSPLATLKYFSTLLVCALALAAPSLAGPLAVEQATFRAVDARMWSALMLWARRSV